jgi:enoyl-CoA hydratase
MNEWSFTKVGLANGPVRLAVDKGIALITLCRPPVNAIDDKWVRRLAEILGEIDRRADVGVLWIRSSEPYFSVGADLEFMRGRFSSDAGRDEIIEFTRTLQQVYGRLEALKTVSVAEIAGAALGGGLELALACDLRIVADSAKIGLPEARLGLLPAGGGTQRLTRICGEAVARRLILGAEVIDGREAVAVGLAHWSAPATDVESLARSVTQRIAELPTTALAACKHCIAASANVDCDGFEEELSWSRMLLGLPETQQRIQQFLEKQH